MKGSPPKKEDYWRIEANYKRTKARGLKTFKPTVTLQVLTRLTEGVKGFARDSNLEQILLRYQRLDNQLSRVETCFEDAARAYEGAVDFAIDVARGK